MSDYPQYDPLTQALRNLPPAPHALSREKLLFEAGLAAGRPRFDWLWKAATGLFASSTVVLMTLFAEPRSQPAGVVQRQFEPARIAPVTPPAAKLSAEVDSYSVDVAMPNADELVAIRLRRDILEGGIENLPDDRATGVASGPRERPLSDILDGYLPGGVFAFPKSPEFNK